MPFPTFFNKSSKRCYFKTWRNLPCFSWRSKCSFNDERKNAVIGGEGNGGIIYPELHYGRDALVGVALFLTHLPI